VGVDPHGSILAQPQSLNERQGSYSVEGIGYDFIPDMLDSTYVDRWVKTDDKESFIVARRLIREEGLLCGGSSGSAMWAALQVAKELKPGQRCVVILPDSVRNYMSKFLNDDWMKAKGFIDVEAPKSKEKVAFKRAHVRDLHLKDAVTVSDKTTCAEAISLMGKLGYDQLPVLSNNKKLVGMVTQGLLFSKIASKRIQPECSVSQAMFAFTKEGEHFKEITKDTPLIELEKFLENHYSAIVTERVETMVNGQTVPTKALKAKHVVTKIDLLQWMVSHTKI